MSLSRHSAGHDPGGSTSRRRRLGRGAAFALSFALIGALAVPAALAGTTPAAAEPGTGTGGATDAPATGDQNAADQATADPAAPEGAAAPADGTAGGTDSGTAHGTTSGTASGSGSAPIQARSVPVPPAGSAVITVKVGGDRQANGSVRGLAGVRLGLFATGTATTGGGAANAGGLPAQGASGARYNAAWAWTTCVSDADGDCSFVIPIRAGTISQTGVPQDTRFWVAQEAGPTGWYSNPTMRVGGFGATPDGTWQYRFRTDTQLRSGVTYSSTAAMPWDTTAEDPDRYFMRNREATNAEDWYAANVSRTTGVWSQSRNNPDMIGGCPINIAMIGDTSGSLGASGIADLKATMSAFADAFRGTNTRMAAFSFSTVSPGNGATNHPTLLPVTTAAQAATFKAQYAGWLSGGGTNWDLGFATAANAAPHYDLAVLLTDGNPTVMRSSPASGASAYNTLQDVDAGIFSANQLKAEGTRVIALGVGPALTAASEANLRAVSGPTKNTDYYRTTSFAEATAALVKLAQGRCSGSIGVQKMIVPTGGTIAEATPAPAGWQFEAANPAGGVQIAPASQTTVAGGQGKVDFGLSFDAGRTSAAVRINEVQQSGYTLVPVGGKNAVCVNLETGAQVTVSNQGDAAKPGFDVTAPQQQRIECTVYNRAPTPGAVTVAKSADPASGTTVVAGQTVSYTLTFRNTGTLPVAVDHDDVLTNVLDDADLVAGSLTADPPLGAVLNGAGDRIRITGTLAGGDTKTVTYRVRVKNPLPATANGVLGNFVVVKDGTPPSSCVPGDPACTEHPIRGTLSWNKVNGHGDLLSGSEWELVPYGSDGTLREADKIAVRDCVAGSAAQCTAAGLDTDPAKGRFLLAGLKIGKYQLRETKAPAGYQLLPQPIVVTVNSAVQLGDIENRQSEVPPIPLTGGVGTLGFFGGAGVLAALAAAAVIWQRRRAHRIEC